MFTLKSMLILEPMGKAVFQRGVHWLPLVHLILLILAQNIGLKPSPSVARTK
jgi:hypothetical protein